MAMREIDCSECNTRDDQLKVNGQWFYRNIKSGKYNSKLCPTCEEAKPMQLGKNNKKAFKRELKESIRTFRYKLEDIARQNADYYNGCTADDILAHRSKMLDIANKLMKEHQAKILAMIKSI